MDRILIVDDDRHVRLMLQKYLLKAGYDTITAENGQMGLERFKEQQPAVVILDLKMPVMDGLQFLKSLKPQVQNYYSVIVLTGYETDADIETCFHLGIQSFLRKPVNLYELNGVVKRTLELIHFSTSLHREIAEKEKANFLLKQTYDGLAEGVVTLDSHFIIRMISSKACKILNVVEPDALDKPAASVLGTSIAGPTGLLAQCFSDKRDISDEPTELLCPSGSIIPILLSIVPLKNSNIQARWLLFFRDCREEERGNLLRSKGIAFGKMIGCAPEMKALFELIDAIAPSNATVLLRGETGSGKEMAAREIHERSRRAQKPFHAVNCAAISPALLESEFFGHERGAFTGAHQMKPGRFELAHQGTLFLDEIGEIPPELQVKLLRALQEQQFERVGGAKTIQVDVRIIAATNQNLTKMVEAKEFREDLYYRLDVVSIELPSLKQRPQDIPLLVNAFVETLNQKENRQIKKISAEMLEKLVRYPWPGNVRELYHAIEYAFAVSRGNVLQDSHLPTKLNAIPKKNPLSSNSPPAPVHKPETPKSEKELILEALEKTNFHKGQAAALMGIAYVTLYRKCKKYGI